MSFGASLHTLRLLLFGRAHSASAINDAIIAISRLPVLEDLFLRMASFFPEVSFAPLADAPKLRVLRCEPLDFRQPTLAQRAQLRMLVRLHTMHSNLSSASLVDVLRAPHSLKWRQIHTVHGVDDHVSAALSTLPTLTNLHTWDCLSVAFLPALGRLLSLRVSMNPNARLAADITAGLSCCSHLTDLSLDNATDVTSQDMSQVLHLLQLRKLVLGRCFALGSLSFLSDCRHLAQTRCIFSRSTIFCMLSWPPLSSSPSSISRASFNSNFNGSLFSHWTR